MTSLGEQKPTILAVIPARGGSKTIPRKNLKLLRGRPLIAYSIETAMQVGRVDRVIVSTDDAEIATISREYDSEVMMRPQHLATDTALVVDAVCDLLHHLSTHEDYDPDGVLLLEPTTPLRSVADVEKCLDYFETGRYDSIGTYSEARVNAHRLWKIDGGTPRPFIDTANPWLPRQLLPECYELNGAVFLFKPHVLVEAQAMSFLGGRTGAIIMPPERSVEIDNEIDFLLAEVVMTYYVSEND